MPEVSDEALVAGYATGDPDAAAVFVRRFQAKAFGLALLITRDPADAEEVAQEAFVRAWRYAAGYDPRRGPVVRWLMGIVRNVAIDRVRVVGRRAEESLPEAVALVDPLDIDEAIGLRDDADRVVSAMQTLPAEQREALLAVTLLGLSAREVSERADLPLGTVKTRVRLALRKLRDELGAQIRCLG
jgi:RNA polymerase sigma-70 factor (ECF subfamily)